MIRFGQLEGVAFRFPNRLTLVALLACLVGGLVAGVLTAATNPLVGVGAIVGILGISALVISSQAGLLLFAVVAYLLPFGVIPVPIGGVRLTFIDLILTTMLLLWMFRLLARPDVGFVTSPLDGFMLVFIGLAFVSFFIGLPKMLPEEIRLFLKLINSLLFFFTITNLVRRPRDVHRLAGALVLASFGAAVVAVALALARPADAMELLSSLRILGYPTGPDVIRYIADTTTVRATGTSVDPNVLGGMMVLAIPLVTAMILAKRPPVGRKWLIPIAIALVACLLLTYSRGALLGAAAGVLFIGSLKDRRIWIAFVVFVVLLYFLPIGADVTDRLQEGLYAEDRATQMRLGEYRDALRLISQYPWFGVGFIKAPTIDLYVAAASIYLMIAEQMGLIGLSAYLIMLGAFFVYVLKRSRLMKDDDLAAIQVGTLGAIAGALIAGLVDHYFFNLVFQHMLALFWLFVGLSVVATRLGTEIRTDADTSIPVDRRDAVLARRP